MPPLLRLLLCVLLAAPPLRAAPSAPDPAPADEAQALIAIDSVCEESPEHCERGRTILSDTLKLREVSKLCNETPEACSLDNLNVLNVAVQRLPFRLKYLDKLLPETSTADLSPFVGILTGEIMPEMSTLSDTKLKGMARDLGKEVAGLEARTADLEGELAGGDPRPADDLKGEVEKLGEEGHASLERFKDLSEGIDHSGQPTTEAVKARRELANRLAVRIASLRDRLIALEHELRLKASPRIDLSKLLKSDEPVPAERAKVIDKDGVRLPSMDAFAAQDNTSVMPSDGELARLYAEASGGAPALARANPSLLDGPKMPVPTPGSGKVPRAPPPPIDPKGPSGPIDAAQRLAGMRGETAQIDAMRRLGLTRTTGDPARYAPLVHKQDKMTCAVVCQQQMLTAAGVIENKDPKAEEVRLRDEAYKKGFFLMDISDPDNPKSLGTPWAYLGSLLTEHNMTVTKEYGGSEDDLAEAAKSGDVLLVDVDPGYLWDMKEHRGGSHSVLITGAEISKRSGKVLGYYINDSATDPPGAGKFIPAGRFHQAWKESVRSIVRAR